MKKILMIDDHPMILEGYINVLSSHVKDEVEIDTANDCDSAWQKLFSNNSLVAYEIIMLDISIPPSKKRNIWSGEDLGIMIKESLPDVKLIILTTFNDNLRIRNILSNVNPDGYLIKSEIEAKTLIDAYYSVIRGIPYYSKTVSKLFKAQFSNDFVLDEIDRSILYQLSLGTKTKHLPNHIPLSLRAIENRKRKLKVIFDVEGEDDRSLLDKARESGYV